MLGDSSSRKDGELDYDESHVKLEIPQVTWYKDPGLRKLYCLMPIFMLGATTNGYDGSLLNGLQTMVPWRAYFGDPNGSRLGLFNAIQNVGGLASVFFAGYVADRLGRRLGIAIGLSFIFLGVILQVIPQTDSGLFIGGRFLVGFGSNFSQVSCPMLIMELAHPAHRGPLTTMYNTLWYLGSIIAAWTVFGTVKYTTNSAWRIPVGVQMLMPGIQFILIWICPESPRWLCAKDRHDEAFAILAKYHANGNENDTFVRAEFAEIQGTIQLEKTMPQQGWFALLKTPGNRKRVLLIVLTCFFSQCSGNGLVSYYLHDILNSVGVTSSYQQSLLNGGLQLWSFAVAIVMALFVDKIGRRPLFLTAGIGMLVTFTIWTACSAVYAQNGSGAAGKVVIVMIFFFYGIAGFAWPGLTVGYVRQNLVDCGVDIQRRLSL